MNLERDHRDMLIASMRLWHRDSGSRPPSWTPFRAFVLRLQDLHPWDPSRYWRFVCLAELQTLRKKGFFHETVSEL